MPFVTKNSSLRLNSDVTRDKRDFKTGEITVKGNGLEELVLTSCDHLSFRAEDTSFDEIVWRGQPDPVKLCWNNTMPVFRVLTNKFTGRKDWERFLKEYRIERMGYKPRTVHYEPHLQDVRVEEDETDKSFPMWVLDELVEMGEFEEATKQMKVDVPSQVKLTKSQYDAIMKEISKRKLKESGKLKGKEPVGNVS